MGNRPGLIVPAVVLLASVAASAAEPERPSLTLELGKPIAAGEPWHAGSLSGNVCLDLPFSPHLATVFAVGTVRGVIEDVEHDTVEIDSAYLVAGVRYTSDAADGARIYVLGAVGALRARSRDEFTYGDSRTVTDDSAIGATAQLAAGVIVAIPRSRFAIGGELSFLAPSTSAPGGLGGRVPGQLLLTAGARITL